MHTLKWLGVVTTLAIAHAMRARIFGDSALGIFLLFLLFFVVLHVLLAPLGEGSLPVRVVTGALVATGCLFVIRVATEAVDSLGPLTEIAFTVLLLAPVVVLYLRRRERADEDAMASQRSSVRR